MMSLNLNLKDKVEKSVLDKLPFLVLLLFPSFLLDFLINPTFDSLLELCWITKGHLWYNQH